MAAEHRHEMNPAHVGEAMTTGDPVGLLRDLEASGRFVRDNGLGRIFHPGRGKVSYREAVRENSLHILIDGNHVSAHIDGISPLVFADDGTPHYSLIRAVRYSLRRAVVHNLTTLADVAWRLARGHWNEHRCAFHCERIDLDDATVESFLSEPSHEPAACDAAVSPATEVGHELRLVPFNVVDEAVHLLDTHAAPWSIQLEARVAGNLDEDRLRTALLEALRRHPMACARKVAAPRTRTFDEWEITRDADVDPLVVTECPDGAALDAAREELQSTAVSLATSPPFRARLARSPDGDLLMLNLNHAATDGFGALRLLRSVARAYSGVADPLPDHDPLEDRTLPVRLAEAERFPRLRRFLALAERLRDLVVPPARIAPAGARPASGDAGYGFHHARLGAQETRSLINHEHPGSVNDLLVAALHLTVEDWNVRRGAACGRVAVLVPANLRPPRWREEVVGNFSLPARVTTRPEDRATPAAALAAVTAQTSRKKRTGMGTALLQLLDQSRRLPLWAKRAGIAALDLSGNRFVDTALLSNLGSVEPPSFGDEAGETTEMWFSAPGRMPLGVSVGALTVSGRLHLAFRYDRRLLDAAAAHQFAEGYLARLDELVAFNPTEASTAA